MKIMDKPGKRELPDRHPNLRIDIRLEDFQGIMKRFPIFFALLLAVSFIPAWAGDLRITLPKRTKPTPVQQLNRDGVKAVEKHKFDKAEKLFYKAYLLDPNDPFTLNNLGYISELQGKVERAQRYYQLASRQDSETVIDQASVPELKGKQLTEITGSFGNRELRVNRGNVEAMSLLSQGRTQEAAVVLQRTLTVDPRNAFTLNNLGFTMESEGDLESAFRYYNRAADANSADPIIVSLDPHWRGKPISEVAANNAKAVHKRIETEQGIQDRVARLNLQGVSALNRNDAQAARSFFEEAYKLDPTNAFTLNNMGYVAETDGDHETADQFYAAAREARDSNARVTLANRREMQGLPLGQVARSNDEGAQANLEATREARRREGGPIQLKRRDNTPVVEPQAAPSQQNQTSPAEAPQAPSPQNESPQNQTPPDQAPQNQAPQSEPLSTSPPQQ
jgi:Flp pilus assembly protein TadD